ncbi:unnamed protein product, partial [Staurois parvus]
NKSIRDISWLLNIPPTVSGIITKWKPLGTTATQPPIGRPRHMTGRGGQRMLKRTVRRSYQLSAESIAKDLQTWCGLQMSPTVRREQGFPPPWPSSCIQAFHHQVQCKASDALV